MVMPQFTRSYILKTFHDIVERAHEKEITPQELSYALDWFERYDIRPSEYGYNIQEWISFVSHLSVSLSQHRKSR